MYSYILLYEISRTLICKDDTDNSSNIFVLEIETALINYLVELCTIDYTKTKPIVNLVHNLLLYALYCLYLFNFVTDYSHSLQK